MSTELEALPKPGDIEKREIPEELTANQRACALLEAVGYSDRETSAVVSLSRPTIQRYRRELPAYNEAVDIYRERETKQLEPMIQRVKVEIVDAALEAFASLRKALNANTLDGQPRWPVRNEAAQLILQHVHMIVGKQTVNEAGRVAAASSDDSGPREPVIIQINPPPQQAVTQPPIEHEPEPEEAEVVEDGQ